jgi:hypothetical protein
MLYQPDLFAESLPFRPYCTDDLTAGLTIRDRSTALKRRYIQPNPPKARAFLIFDIDRPAAFCAAFDADLAPPSWISVNPANSHAHVGYALSVPLITSDRARLAPLRFAAAVEQGYRDRLGADSAYGGLITKNPLNPHWRTTWGHGGLYGLDDLSEYLPVLPRLTTKRAAASGLGRNVALFESLRVWAYKARAKHTDRRAWAEAVLAQASAFNQYAEPLPASEVRAIAQSVQKWVWERFGAGEYGQRFIARQTKKSQKAVILRQSAAMDTTAQLWEQGQ